MPLSEHEKRVLDEIARHLSEEDPKFVENVESTTATRLHLRRLRWALVGFLLGLATLLAITFHFAFGVAGFAIMLVSLLFAASAIRGLGSGVYGLVAELGRTLSRHQRR